MSATLSETELISAIRTNSRGGYEQVYQQYGANLYGIIRKTVGNDQLATVLFRESMVEVWKRIDEFEQSGSAFLPWMVLRIIRPKMARAQQK